jgi:hypothetical protein
MYSVGKAIETSRPEVNSILVGPSGTCMLAGAAEEQTTIPDCASEAMDER